jgi:hypothetical protein
MISRFIAVTVPAVLIFHTAPCLAQTSPPEFISFSYLKAATPGGNSALSGECEGTTASREITCRFTQISVRYQLDPKNVSAEIEQAITQLRAEAGKDPRKYADQICAEVRKSSRAEWERKLQAIWNPRTRQTTREFLALCENFSMPSLEALTRRNMLAASRTCNVSTFQNNPVTYKKVSPNKWVANVGPEGMCSSIYLYTMENEPKYSNLWTWSQVRTYVDTSEKLCKGFETNNKIEFSWKGDDPDVTCETITFGF